MGKPTTIETEVTHGEVNEPNRRDRRVDDRGTSASAAQNIAQKSVGTVLGTIWFKKLRNDPKSLQMNSARPGVYLGPIQRVRKSLEADKRCRLSILSLLRMPISPLRRRKQST